MISLPEARRNHSDTDIGGLNVTATDRSSSTTAKSSRQTHRITITDAATKFDKSPSALRRLIDKGVLTIVKDEKGRILLDEEALHIYLSQTAPAHSPKSESKISGASAKSMTSNSVTNAEVTAELYVEMLKREKEINLQHLRTIEEQKKELYEERKRNHELQNDLLKLTKEMQGILNKDAGLMGWLRTKKKE